MPPDASSGDPAPVTKAKDSCGGFFAVDRRAWHLVTKSGMNPAVAYLVMARGTGADNRRTMWSANAIERKIGIARSRCKLAVKALEETRTVWRDPAKRITNATSWCQLTKFGGVKGHLRPLFEDLVAEHQIPW